MNFVDQEWEQFISAIKRGEDTTVVKSKAVDTSSDKPLCNDLYISTKTKVLFLNSSIDINRVFWEIPVIQYWTPKVGIIKKQMKVISNTKEEFAEYKGKLENIPYYTEHVIKSIDNPNARRNKFKDERKITVGVSKRDIMNCRGKVKNAFYNCFALILRIIYQNEFHEIHAKVFNTGKMEIPGILNDELLNDAKGMILSILRPILGTEIDYVEDNDEENNVLINSNFNCGFYIDRDKLYTILRNKYNIDTAYDPCSYPGVKSKFYFKRELGFNDELQKGVIQLEDHSKKVSELDNNNNYVEVSFMIFRTGSCLIVGNCTEKILRFVYSYIKKVLEAEYSSIFTKGDEEVAKVKQTKQRKKKITITPDFYRQHIAKNYEAVVY